MVFLNYSKDALDEEYLGEQLYGPSAGRDPNARQKIYDVSMEVFNAHDVHKDIAYGSHKEASYDLFRVERENAPVVVFFHGGYWRRNDKRSFTFIAPQFVKAGIAVAMADYPLAPGATFDVLVQHARACVAHLAKHGKELGIDPTRIYVSGHSAGGHLTAAIAQTKWSDYGLDFDPVRGACAISGLYDLLPLKLSKLNEVVNMDTETAYRNSPIHFISNMDKSIWKDRKFLLSVGELEPHEYHEQQRKFAEAYTNYGLECTVVPDVGNTHGSIIMKMMDGSVLSDAMIEMVQRDDA